MPSETQKPPKPEGREVFSLPGIIVYRGTRGIHTDRTNPDPLFLCQIIIINGADFLTQQEQGNQVGDNHKAVEHIGQIPNQIDFAERTQNDSKQNQCAIDAQVSSLKRKRMLDSPK